LKQVAWHPALLKRSSDEGFQRIWGEERGQYGGDKEEEEEGAEKEEEVDDSGSDHEPDEVAVGKQLGRRIL
jgi:hypothetical protein